MGNANAKIADFDLKSIPKYEKDRLELRRALILSFVNNPENNEIVSKIAALKALLIKEPHICSTAARELARKFDYNPTCIESAYAEIDRLYCLYETSKILKSVQCRIGPVACPMGHYTPFFEDLAAHSMEEEVVECNICQKSIVSGYHCGYCTYNVCVPCSTVYCPYGHTMKLWTNPEAEHHCRLCNTYPIISGYHCSACGDYDFCDCCVQRSGRKQVERIILDRMTDDLQFFEDHKHESEIALKTINTHNLTLEADAYPTILHLYQFSLSTGDIRVTAEAEVRKSQMIALIIDLRKELSQHTDLCATAHRESLRDGNFTQEEVERLKFLLDASDLAKSALIRNENTVACPLGHAAVHFQDRPAQYAKRASVTSKGSKAQCRICARAAYPEGFHCDFCEYDLCMVCGIIYCPGGHPMVMWTVPEANATCTSCGTTGLTLGYHCEECDIDLCDMCTTKKQRGLARGTWDTEMAELIQFIKDNRLHSDAALYYDWRHDNYIVSMGRLADYVKELRTVKEVIRKQVIQKPIIDAIKSLRVELSKNPELCATAAREAARKKDYIYPKKKFAIAEMERLGELVEDNWKAQNPALRLSCTVACPLRHAMPPIGKNLDKVRGAGQRNNDKNTNKPKPIEEEGEEDDDVSNQKVDMDMGSSSSKQPTVSEENNSSAAAAAAAQAEIDEGWPVPQCKVCATTDLNGGSGGHYCDFCEYSLCHECKVVYCREGHVMNIWTLAEASTLSCSLCKTEHITSGYRCMECQIDLCDMCTARDGRNALMTGIRKEIGKLRSGVDVLVYESTIAAAYVKEDSNSKQVMEPFLRHTMSIPQSVLVEKLNELRTVQGLIDDERKEKKMGQKLKGYGKKYGFDL